MRHIKSINEKFKDDLSGLNLNQMLEYNHTYKNSVYNSLLNIIMCEKRISEKDFKKIDNLQEELEKFYIDNEQELNNIINLFEKNKLRDNYCAEKIYAELYKK
jgi:hypothetical protein